MGASSTEQAQNLAQFTGSAACELGPVGGVVDMTGTLDPMHPSSPRTSHLAFEMTLVQNGELAYNTTAEVKAYHYKLVESTKNARVVSMAWAHQSVEAADRNHVCGYCAYRSLQGRCFKDVDHIAV